MTTEEVVGRFRDLAELVIGDAKCKQFAELVLRLENVKDIRTLRPFLQRG